MALPWKALGFVNNLEYEAEIAYGSNIHRGGPTSTLGDRIRIKIILTEKLSEIGEIQEGKYFALVFRREKSNSEYGMNG